MTYHYDAPSHKFTGKERDSESGLDNAVQDLYLKQFAEAKRLVVQSRAWSDRYESDTKLREAAREALRQLADSKSPDLPRIVFEDENE